MLNWLRSRREARAENKKSWSLNRFVALHAPVDAGWSPAGAAALAQEGFARNPVVYRCVRTIAENVASLHWLLRDRNGPLNDHPALELLAEPNEKQAGAVFFERLCSHLLVFGDAFAQAIEIDEAPREIHLLRPDQVEAETDSSGWPVAWRYRTGSDSIRIPAGGERPAILHLSLSNPLDGLRGMAPLRAAHMALDVHNAASRWNKALLDNSARPSGALVYMAGEASHLSQEQFDRLKQELEEGYAGASRAGRPMVLEGGLDWKAMGYSPRDMDFMQARNGAARDIALAFGVPPMLLGIPGDNTYANYQEANRALWRNTVLPLASRICGAFGQWLSALYGTPLRLDFDRDAIEALSADRDSLWKRINDAAFLSDDEKREAVGYAPAPAPAASESESRPSESPAQPPRGGDAENRPLRR